MDEVVDRVPLRLRFVSRGCSSPAPHAIAIPPLLLLFSLPRPPSLLPAARAGLACLCGDADATWSIRERRVVRGEGKTSTRGSGAAWEGEETEATQWREGREGSAREAMEGRREGREGKGALVGNLGRTETPARCFRSPGAPWVHDMAGTSSGAGTGPRTGAWERPTRRRWIHAVSSPLPPSPPCPGLPAARRRAHPPRRVIASDLSSWHLSLATRVASEAGVTCSAGGKRTDFVAAQSKPQRTRTLRPRPRRLVPSPLLRVLVKSGACTVFPPPLLVSDMGYIVVLLNGKLFRTTLRLRQLRPTPWRCASSAAPVYTLTTPLLLLPLITTAPLRPPSPHRRTISLPF
ncbi:hypothetical protein C8R45DRAFT_533514 [Mycena sanguinolenta]|nr:hypothetical protein C8R45DRAFT_533514 [Mycena sanguinolenta]